MRSCQITKVQLHTHTHYNNSGNTHNQQKIEIIEVKRACIHINKPGQSAQNKCSQL